MIKHPHFIDKATADSHGQFKKKAQEAGMSTAMFAQAHMATPGKLGEQARLAHELIGFAHDAHHGEDKKTLADRLHPAHPG